MKWRLGTTLYLEGDLRVVEVLGEVHGHETVVGFTVAGPGIQPLIISPDFTGALLELRRYEGRNAAMTPTLDSKSES